MDSFGVGCHNYLGCTTYAPVAAILNYLSIGPTSSGPLFLKMEICSLNFLQYDIHSGAIAAVVPTLARVM